MGTRTTTILSLFSGYGGLERGVAAAIGGARAVCMVEREAFVIANMVAQMEAGALAQAPIWTDVTTFDGRGWRPDMLVGGPPCQPFSTAGKRKHTDDERWIWADVARIIGECQAPIVFLENVPGLRKRGLSVMLRDLAAMGYDAEWGCFKASDAGAPHRRNRLFLLAYSSGLGLSELWPSHDQNGGDAPRHQPNGCHAFPPSPDDTEGWRRWTRAGGPQPGVCGGSHGAPDRVDRIRLLGNGVVPAQAALAFRELSARALA
ncbi:MAG: putative cytosine-specific methyltransferase [Prokaryotic dsDNA virus sp.]|nr:MAG: putative cytosine-specific methyltransferase [Prokaryotic dsDNA virus sp.]|tara:strand:- start:529 stop:1311 length:783 start_codon:yes stop_codon:yes gene_type:complete